MTDNKAKRHINVGSDEVKLKIKYNKMREEIKAETESFLSCGMSLHIPKDSEFGPQINFRDCKQVCVYTTRITRMLKELPLYRLTAIKTELNGTEELGTHSKQRTHKHT